MKAVEQLTIAQTMAAARLVALMLNDRDEWQNNAITTTDYELAMRHNLDDAAKIFEMTTRRPSTKQLIEKVDFVQSHKTGSLPSYLDAQTITETLGFEPGHGDEDKVTMQWDFEFNGVPCSIWDYKGNRWSTFGPAEVFETLFPAARVAA